MIYVNEVSGRNNQVQTKLCCHADRPVTAALLIRLSASIDYRDDRSAAPPKAIEWI